MTMRRRKYRDIEPETMQLIFQIISLLSSVALFVNSPAGKALIDSIISIAKKAQKLPEAASKLPGKIKELWNYIKTAKQRREAEEKKRAKEEAERAENEAKKQQELWQAEQERKRRQEEFTKAQEKLRIAIALANRLKQRVDKLHRIGAHRKKQLLRSEQVDKLRSHSLKPKLEKLKGLVKELKKMKSGYDTILNKPIMIEAGQLSKQLAEIKGLPAADSAIRDAFYAVNNFRFAKRKIDRLYNLTLRHYLALRY